MRRTVAALVVLMLGTAILHAQESPWCVRLDAFTKNCDFATYNDCMAIAGTASRPATGASSCVRNPDYKAPAVREKSAKPAKTAPAAH
jgi:hypothetical protein